MQTSSHFVICTFSRVYLSYRVKTPVRCSHVIIDILHVLDWKLEGEGHVCVKLNPKPYNYEIVSSRFCFAHNLSTRKLNQMLNHWDKNYLLTNFRRPHIQSIRGLEMRSIIIMMVIYKRNRKTYSSMLNNFLTRKQHHPDSNNCFNP